ncbi:MAG TPA: hypothetical protein VEH80_07175 [Candidatus Bathyarchaeia archaeon]|nr:hypothetical protein [Candidatus Bathyarchaeia archaeon]
MVEAGKTMRGSSAMLCLLLFAAPAWADGSWILWTSTNWRGPDGKEEPPAFTIYGSYPSREACVAELDAGEKLPPSSDPGVKDIRDRAAPTTLHVILDTGTLGVGSHFLCLPDTVDPPGPKAK